MAGLKRRKLGKSASNANVESSKTGGDSGYIPYLKKHGVGTFKPTKTHYDVDVIPYVVTAKDHPDKVKVGDWAVSRNILIHSNIGKDNRKLLCPSSIGKHCPICDIAKDLWKDAKTEDEKKAAAAKSKKKRTIYVLKVDGEDELKVWDVSFGFFTEKLLEEINEAEKYIEYACPDEGYTIKLRFKESEWQGHKFYEPSKVGFSDNTRVISDEILEQAPKIDDFLDFLDGDTIEAILYDLAIPTQDDDENVEDNAPKKTSRKSKTTAKEDVEFDKKCDKEAAEDEDDNKKQERLDEEAKEQAKADKKAKRAKAKADKEAAEKKAKEEEATKKETSDTEEGTCPSGHVWAEDVDEKDDCTKCPLHKACDKAFEEMD